MATSEQIKELRERTGSGILECKKALTENGDNIEKAIDWLRSRGMAKAGAKSSRQATEGLVEAYIHAGGKVGVLVEINCETDFVARNENFRAMVRDIAMHIAASSPQYVSREEIPSDVMDRERQVQTDRTLAEEKPGSKPKPAAVVQKIVDGRMDKFYEEVCLLDQKFIKDDTKTVDAVIKAQVATIGENIRIRRFVRFVLGEGLEKKSTDFAAEVAAAVGAQ